MASDCQTKNAVLEGRNSEPLFVALAYLFGQFTVLSASGLFPGENPLLAASITSTIVAAGAAVLAGMWVNKSNGGWFIGNRRISIAQYFHCSCAGLVVAASVFALASAVPSSSHADPMLAEAFLSQRPGILLPWIASVVLVAPIGEEMVFRGAIQGHLSRYFGTVIPIGASALLFVLVHIPQIDGYWPAMLGLLILGVTAGVARRQTGSLLGAVIVHVAYNGATMTVVLIERFSR